MEAISDRPVTYVEDEITAEGGNEDDERFGYCYYKLASGWIAQGRADPSSIETYKKKGCQPLVEQFGRHVMNPAIVRDRRGNALPQWQPYFQPYDKLLLDAPEIFPVEQIVAHHWHRGVTASYVEYLADGRYRTHRRKVQFPQLAGLAIPEFPCVICGEVFNAGADLNKHTAAAHPEQGTILKLAETQEAIATAITQANTGGGDFGAVLQAIVTTQTQMGQVLAQLLAQPPAAPARRSRSRTHEERGLQSMRDEKGHFLGSAHVEETTDAGTDSPDT